MALNFNPFDKPKPKSEEKKKFTKVKVFERADFEKEMVEPPPQANEIQENRSLENNQRETRESLENNQSISREEPPKTRFSRESPVSQLEPLQRVSRESLEKTPPLLFKVVGLQRQVLLTIFSILQSNGSKTSPPLAIEVIASRVNTTVGNTQNAIKELVKKNLMIRKDFQRGRGGWTIYELEETIFSALDKEKIRESLENLQRVSIQQTGATFRETSPNSSSDLIKEEKKLHTIQIPEELKTLISAKEVSSILEKGLLPEEDLQRSLEHFAYDSKNNLVRAKTSPVNLLFGLLRSGKPYRSLKLIELENEELREYQKALAILETQNRELKEAELKNKFQTFLETNPDFLEEVRKTAGGSFNLSEEMLQKLAFSRWAESHQPESSPNT